jgi:hypothetical protein
MSADIINASFELGAAFAVALHCRRIAIDKQVKGVSAIAVGFFVAWGFWNVFYYPHLDQPFSAVCAIAVTLVNLAYVLLLIYYGECLWPWRVYHWLRGGRV